MPERWYPLTITQTDIEGGFQIVLTTDRPCHLWLFYTMNPPWVHRITRLERGLRVPWDAYWCYTSWQLIEQEEAGDTTTHTFQWPGWEHCQTKYFRFHGTIGGVNSPSDSPIFWKHFVFIPPPPPAELAYSHCAVIGNHTTWARTSRGMGFKALASGTAKTLAVDIDKWGAPGPIIFRMYHYDSVGHQPIEPPLWQVSLSDLGVPASPNHTPVIFTIPDTPIVEGQWYCFGLKATNEAGGNGYHLWYSSWCHDPEDTEGQEWLNGWVWNQSMDNIDYWFELKS